MMRRFCEVWRLAWGILLFAMVAQVSNLHAFPLGAKNTSANNPARWLSETILFDDIRSFQVSETLREFRPNYPLWTDGALKTRWVYFPPGRTIDTSDPDQWKFPVGTVFFKEFRKSVEKGLYSMQEIRVETRVLAKTGDGVGADAWTMRHAAGTADGSDGGPGQRCSRQGSRGDTHVFPYQSSTQSDDYLHAGR